MFRDRYDRRFDGVRMWKFSRDEAVMMNVVDERLRCERTKRNVRQEKRERGRESPKKKT